MAESGRPASSTVTSRSRRATLPAVAARSARYSAMCGPCAEPARRSPAKLAGLMTVVAPAWRARSSLSSALTTTLIGTCGAMPRAVRTTRIEVSSRPADAATHFARSIFTAARVALRVASPSSTATPRLSASASAVGRTSITTIRCGGKPRRISSRTVSSPLAPKPATMTWSCRRSWMRFITHASQTLRKRNW